VVQEGPLQVAHAEGGGVARGLAGLVVHVDRGEFVVDRGVAVPVVQPGLTGEFGQGISDGGVGRDGIERHDDVLSKNSELASLVDGPVPDRISVVRARLTTSSFWLVQVSSLIVNSIRPRRPSRSRYSANRDT